MNYPLFSSRIIISFSTVNFCLGCFPKGASVGKVSTSCRDDASNDVNPIILHSCDRPNELRNSGTGRMIVVTRDLFASFLIAVLVDFNSSVGQSNEWIFQEKFENTYLLYNLIGTSTDIIYFGNSVNFENTSLQFTYQLKIDLKLTSSKTVK